MSKETNNFGKLFMIDGLYTIEFKNELYPADISIAFCINCKQTVLIAECEAGFFEFKINLENGERVIF